MFDKRIGVRLRKDIFTHLEARNQLFPGESSSGESEFLKERTETQEKCIVPNLSDMNDSSFSRYMMDSHVWVTEKNEAYGEYGILVRDHCSNCGLERIMILHNIDESLPKKQERATSLSRS